MRILLANDGSRDAGGVHTYLEAVAGGLEERGHEVRLLHRDEPGQDRGGDRLSRVPEISVSAEGLDLAIARVRAWQPALAFSHNMGRLEVDRRLIDLVPVVKFMHGYFGTCISGLKMHAAPRPAPCARCYGPPCLGLFYPRRCGQLSPLVAWRQWRWTEHQRTLLPRYARIIVASRHMRDEFVKNGSDPASVIANPLFAGSVAGPAPSPTRGAPHVAFMARMTSLKGGDLLIRAARVAADQLGRPIRLTMIGDGPERPAWQALARELGVESEFVGWVAGDRRWELLGQASVVALPSVWPEPFGLVGLEAGSLGIPAVAVDTGGIGEWLQGEVNGVLVPSPATPTSFGAALAGLFGDRPRLERLGEGAKQVANQMTLARHLDRLETIFGAVAPSGAC